MKRNYTTKTIEIKTTTECLELKEGDVVEYYKEGNANSAVEGVVKKYPTGLLYIVWEDNATDTQLTYDDRCNSILDDVGIKEII